MVEVEDHEVEEQAIYQIRVQGRLDACWSYWFNGLTVTADDEDPSVTVITAVVSDQAALRGILNKVWDLNLILRSVISLQMDEGGTRTKGGGL